MPVAEFLSAVLWGQSLLASDTSVAGEGYVVPELAPYRLFGRVEGRKTHPFSTGLRRGWIHFFYKYYSKKNSSFALFSKKYLYLQSF